MRTGKKLLGLLLAVVMLAGVFAYLKPDAGVRADNNDSTLKISIKKVNSGTGIKISISKSKETKGYYVYAKDIKNSYTDYLSKYFDGTIKERCLVEIDKDGSKKRTCTIGLPKGTYTIYVESKWESLKSEEKTVKIKAAKKISVNEKEYDFQNVKVGDVVKFGSYEQDDNMKNGKEEIEWIVLSKDEKEILLLSKYILDCLPYDTADEGKISWESSSLRKWLNSYFYKTAFTKKERKIINTSKIENSTDKVFLLSEEDIYNSKYGFDDEYGEYHVTRRASATAFAVIQGTGVSISDSDDYKTSDGENSSSWWLRTYDNHNYYGTIFGNAYAASGSGGLYNDIDPNSSCVGIRPAIYIKL